MVSFLRLTLLLSLSMGLLLGCKDDDDEHDHDVPEHDHATCGLQENCAADALTLEPGLKFEGEHFTVELTEAEWVDVKKDQVHWMASVTDAEGEAVTDATVNVNAYSIDCMHDGFEPAKDVTADDDGMYMLMPAFLHGGPWNVELTITQGDVSEELRPEFCVPPSAEDGEHEGHEDHMAGAAGESEHEEHMTDEGAAGDSEHEEHMTDEQGADHDADAGMADGEDS